MNNDIKVIKVLCQKEENIFLANLKLSFQMSSFEIEDKILLGDSKNVIKIIYQAHSLTLTHLVDYYGS